MEKLYYVERGHVLSVAYTRDRAMCVAPIFFERKRDALIAAKDDLTVEINTRLARIMEIEHELANAKAEPVANEQEFFYASGIFS